MMARESHGKTFGLFPYGFRTPTLARARRILWNAREGRFPIPTFFGVGWTALRNAPHHPLQAVLLAAFVLWRARKRRGR